MRGNVTVQQAISKGKMKLIVLPMFLIISFFKSDLKRRII